jgi:Domain of unknown function (DUF4111)/Nucleotidyltransferase domain
VKLSPTQEEIEMTSYRTAVAIDADVATFAEAVTKRLQKILGEILHGVYLSGSVALGGYIPGQSDIDIFAVSQGSLEVEKKQTIAEIISGEAANCPTRGMEFVLYSRGAVAKPSRTPRFEINLNAGPQMSYHLSFDPASEPSHWFVLDISIVREHGQQLIGPPAAGVFAPIPRPWVLDALEDSLGWHADHETLLHYSVLNACRSWRYAEEGLMSSKDAAAVWALSRAEDPSIIDSALAIRRGDRTRSLEPAEVRAFVLSVKARIARMPR